MQERMEQLPSTAWMQEVESHTRAQGDKAGNNHAFSNTPCLNPFIHPLKSSILR